MKRFIPFLLALLAPLLISMNKKKEFTITFHAQAEPMDMPKSYFPFQLEGQQRLFKVIPEITQNNVVAFHPFFSETGVGNGVALQLDFRGKNALEMTTRLRQGQFMLAMVNGTPVDYVVIDQVVRDGMITIWQGVPDEVVANMDKKVSRIRTGETPTMNQSMEMIPTTRKEKKRMLKAQRDAEKAAQKEAESGEYAPVEEAPQVHGLPSQLAPGFDAGVSAAPEKPVEPIAPFPLQ